MIQLVPFISIVVPCRNEEAFIGKCLDSLIDQEYPCDNMEVLVVDGMSNDGTREIVRRYAEQYTFINMLDNPKMVTPAAMNVGTSAAKGEYILILGSHAKTDASFIMKNVESMVAYNADCVGGVMTTLPAADTPFANAIAIALSHPFGVGNAFFRTGANEVTAVDTVAFGCYKREVFQRVGLFDEDLVRNQDDELNMRLIKNGGKILLIPGIVSYYYARGSLAKIVRMYYQYGYFKPLVVQKVGAVLTWRQLIPALFVSSLIASLGLSIIFKPFLWLFFFILSLYSIANLAFSLQITLRKGLKYFSLLPVVFSALHVSYGIGYLKGIWDFLILKKNERKKIGDVPLTR